MGEQNGTGQGVMNAITRTMESNSSRQVFGEPITMGEVMIIPVARVRGGGGGGGGGGASSVPMGGASTGDGSGSGSGSGMSLSAKPVGAFVVRGSEVSWRPAMDLNRIILGGQIVAISALLVLRSLIKRRRRRRW